MPEKALAEQRVAAVVGTDDIKLNGSLEFVQEYGGNNSMPSYQEASGAPVEIISPLGLEVTGFTSMFLNIGQMIGTGVFSTRQSSTLEAPYFAWRLEDYC